MSVHKREGKRGTRWIVRYYDRGGRQRQETFTAKADADRRDREVRRELETGAPVGEGRRVTLTEYVQTRWAPQHADQVAPKTRSGYLHAWKTRIKPELGETPIAMISTRTVKDWQAGQLAEARRLSVERDADHLIGQVAIERARTVLSSILTHAAEDGLIAANPVSAVRKLKGKRDAAGELRKPRPLTVPDPAQVERLRLAASDRDSTLIAVLAYAGLRPGEAWRLQWADLDGGVIQVWARKTGRTRFVPMRAPLSAWLEQWRGASADTSPAALVFPGRDGNVADHRAWGANHWRPLVKAAGLDGMRAYDLRHACASLLVAEQRPIVECAEWMGHSPMMFLNTYAHVLESLRGAGKVDGDELIREAAAGAIFASSSQVALPRETGPIEAESRPAGSPANQGDW